jgi:hypothetical protein
MLAFLANETGDPHLIPTDCREYQKMRYSKAVSAIQWDQRGQVTIVTTAAPLYRKMIPNYLADLDASPKKKRPGSITTEASMSPSPKR